MAFCSDAGRGDELLRRLGRLEISQNSKPERLQGQRTADLSTNSINTNKDLEAIMMAMRKLREGIVATRRIDDFSVQAYIFCIRLSILVKSWESYHPALQYLLKTMHPAHPLSTTELQEFVGYSVLDLACRQHDLAKAFSVKMHCGLHDSKVDALLRSLAHDNYFVFWRVKRSVDGHKAKLIEFAEDGIKRQALKCVGRSYMSIDLASLEKIIDTPWTSLTKEYGVGWQLDGAKVIVRKPKGS